MMLPELCTIYDWGLSANHIVCSICIYVCDATIYGIIVTGFSTRLVSKAELPSHIDHHGRPSFSQNMPARRGSNHSHCQRRCTLDGSLQYIVEKGGNTDEVAYQEASGAPIESDSPLGYSVGAITIVFLNLSKMIGTGIYSTRRWYQWVAVSEIY
jgi:hypothetical protein